MSNKFVIIRQSGTAENCSTDDYFEVLSAVLREYLSGMSDPADKLMRNGSIVIGSDLVAVAQGYCSAMEQAINDAEATVKAAHALPESV
jgi:hypothetical protein